MRDFVLLHVNGVPHRIGGARAFQTVSRFLREDQRATGTKIVCEEGDCGACTVLIGRREDDGLKYKAVNSCIQFVFQLDCAHVVTVEGLGEVDGLHPVQAAFVEVGAVQCGFCTPGLVVAAADLIARTPAPSEDDIREALSGNICRCTGYQKIVDAVKLTAERT